MHVILHGLEVAGSDPVYLDYQFLALTDGVKEIGFLAGADFSAQGIDHSFAGRA